MGQRVPDQVYINEDMYKHGKYNGQHTFCSVSKGQEQGLTVFVSFIVSYLAYSTFIKHSLEWSTDEILNVFKY